VGGFYPIPPQSRRTIDAEAGFAFDRNPLSPHFGRLYLVYTDVPSSGSAATQIMVRFSDNNGSDWSAAIRIDDDNSGRSKFLPRIFSNPRSGNVAVCWHDARNSSTNTAMEEFCSLTTPNTAAPIFLSNAQIGAALSTSTANAIQFGDYSGLVYHQGRAHPVWADSSNSTGDNPDGTSAFDIYTARVTGGAAGQENPLIATHDYNGDGLSDIAWRDNTGNLAVWLMSSTQVLSFGGFGAVPTIWSIVGQRDFDGDGNTDLLWRDSSGNTAIWFMNGTQVASSASLGNIPVNWSVIATGDFNGDGKGDILWQDSTGNLSVWLMNGATVLSSGGIGNVPPGTFVLLGTGDFNGDGKADLLWNQVGRAPGGDVSIWFMNGTQVSSAAAVGNIPAVWSVVGTGDFNGDGMADIVWRDDSGNTSIWLMSGATVLGAVGLGNVPTTWSIVQTGDYNGDGKSDLLWRDNLGNTAMWFMNGTAVAGSAGVGNIPTNWTVQSVNAE
jgi:FG-GAP-like repeat